jgi:hypothetical protein
MAAKQGSTSRPPWLRVIVEKAVKVNVLRLLGGAVSLCGLAVFVEFVAGPEEAAGEVVDVRLALHGLVVVTDGGAEDAGFAVLVGPDAGVIFFGANAVSLAEDGSVGPNLSDLVKLTLGGFPAFAKPFHNGVLGLEIFDVHCNVLLMAYCGDTEEFTPFVGDFVCRAIAMHGAVQHHRWDPRITMSRSNPFHKGFVTNCAETFVVHDDIEVLDPILLLVNGEAVGASSAALVEDGPAHVGALADTLADDGFLFGIIVAATAGDEQGFERFGGLN